MGQNPRRTTSARHRHIPPPGIPSFAQTCRLIRDELGLTREKAEKRTGVSRAHIYNIESGKFSPNQEMLENLIAGYQLNPTQARHLRELRAPPEYLRPLDELRRSVNGDTGLINHLADLEQRDILAAYIDPLWNILACNDAFRSVLPEIDHAEGLTGYIFAPIAKSVFVDWEHEAAHIVARIRGALGRYRESGQSQALVRMLRHNKDFHRLWISTIQVMYRRDVGSLLHLCEPDTGDLSSYLLSLAEVDQTQNALLLTAIRKPYSGPEPPARIAHNPTAGTTRSSFSTGALGR